MKKCRVLQLGLQLDFLVVTKLTTHGIYTTLSVIKQVATIIIVEVDTLCHIQYCIYGATHM
jgi:hypothetical protein